MKLKFLKFKIVERKIKKMSTNTENVYESVSKETFDAHMQRIDQRFEMQDKLTAERLARMQAELGQSMERLVGVVNAMNSRLDTIYSSNTRGRSAGLGILLLSLRRK